MKEQEVYNYVVTESVKNKDDNGQIESVDKNILGTGQVTAYDDASAKVQAQNKTDLKAANIKEVKVDVSRFPG